MSERTPAAEHFGDFRTALAAERLILSATDQIITRMAEQGTLRVELADRLGVSKGEISQRLNGPRNLTLRTLAEMAEAIGCRFTIRLRPGTEVGALDIEGEYGAQHSGSSGQVKPHGR